MSIAKFAGGRMRATTLRCGSNLHHRIMFGEGSDCSGLSCAPIAAGLSYTSTGGCAPPHPDFCPLTGECARQRLSYRRKRRKDPEIWQSAGVKAARQAYADRSPGTAASPRREPRAGRDDISNCQPDLRHQPEHSDIQTSRAFGMMPGSCTGCLFCAVCPLKGPGRSNRR